MKSGKKKAGRPAGRIPPDVAFMEASGSRGRFKAETRLASSDGLQGITSYVQNSTHWYPGRGCRVQEGPQESFGVPSAIRGVDSESSGGEGEAQAIACIK